MRYVRCHECGSTEVPTLATCPSCGIKTPIQIRTRWWLLAVVVVGGVALGVAVGREVFSAGDEVTGLQARLSRLEADFGAQKTRADQLQRENTRLERENTTLLAASSGGQPPTRMEPPRVETTEPVATPPTPAGDDRLRLAHVRWAAAFTSAARLWQPPYPPLSALRDVDRDLAGLDVRTRELSSAFAAISGSAGQVQALLRFEGRLRALRDALDPGRQARIVVSAQTDWREGGVEVQMGDLVYLEALGDWSMGVAAAALEDGGEVAPVVIPVPITNAAPVGAVLWRVRGGSRTDALLPGGPSEAVRVDAGGALEFRINEQQLDDNAGSVSVTVVVLPKSVTDGLQAAGSELIGR